MLEKINTPFWKTFFIGIFGGALGALIGALIGYGIARFNDPSGWSNIPNALSGAIYGYGLGVGLILFIRYASPHPPSAFSRAFLGSLGGLFLVIFLSAPLHLDFFPPLMWGLLILFPPLIASRLLAGKIKNSD